MASRRIEVGFVPPCGPERVMMAHKRDRFDITNTFSTTGYAYWTDTDLRCVPMLPPFTQSVKPTIFARIVHRPGTFNFSSICHWLLKIMTLALDSMPTRIPRSSAPPHHPKWVRAPTMMTSASVPDASSSASHARPGRSSH